MSRQWYIRNGGSDYTLNGHSENLNSELLARGEELKFHPDFMKVRYSNWVHGLHNDWLVSRQRFFGVPIPLWYRINQNGEVDYDQVIIPAEETLPIDPTSDVPAGFQEAQRGEPGGFAAEVDILDTWATSSLTPKLRAAGCAIMTCLSGSTPWMCVPKAKILSVPGCFLPWCARIWSSMRSPSRMPPFPAGF